MEEQGTIVVRNLRFLSPEDRRLIVTVPYKVKVDRSTVLGNRYEIGVDGTREEVIERYRKWFAEKMAEGDNEQSREVARLEKLFEKFGYLELLCWCEPEACHAEVIRQWILP